MGGELIEKTVMEKSKILKDIVYIMEGISSFVHSTIQQFGDAKLLHVPSYFVLGTTQNVECLDGKEEEKVTALWNSLH